MSRTLSQEYTPERLSVVLDVTRLGMWDWNPQTSEMLYDDVWASMLGVSVDQLSMNLDDWATRVHPDDIESATRDIQAHFAGETPFYENLHRMRHADGRWIYILSRGRVVKRNADGEPVWFTGTHADLTPLKEAEFEALLASKAKDRFVSSISHELRAPLHAIAGVLEHVVGHQETDEDRQLINTAREATTFLTSLVNDLLDAAKINMADFSIRASDFDVLALIANMEVLFRERFLEKQLKLQIEIGDAFREAERVVLYSDRGRFSQILINLLSNALKFTHEGTVTVRLKPMESDFAPGIAIEIEDTGQGIANTEQIFAPFYSKEDDAKADGPNSTGLGLHICHQLSEQMGLKIEVESTPGQGSTFRLMIPGTIIKQMGGETERERPARDLPMLNGIRVLVVDDDAINRKVLNLHLSKSGAEVLFAEQGKEALEVLESNTVDIVLSDLHMPEMGGLELCTHLKSSPRLADVPVVIASADSRDISWPKCEAAGASEYLQKPFSAADVRRLVAHLMS